jgi:integrase
MAGRVKGNRRYGSCTLTQRGKKGIWWIEYRQEGKRIRYSLETGNLSIAEQKAVGISSALDRGDYQMLSHGGDSITFGDFLDNVFCERFTGWTSDETWRNNRSKFKQFKEVWGDKPLDKVSEYDIRSYLDQKSAKYSSNTRNKHSSTLSTVLKNAKNWGYLKHDPMREITREKEESKSPDPLTEEEIAKLMKELTPPVQRLVLLMLDTGIRMGELVRLKFEDVDFKNQQITIQKAKNGRFRVIPLTNRARAVLRAIQSDSEGDKVCSIKRFNKGLTAASKRAGIGHVHPHRFRHTFATEIWESGGRLQDLMEVLGHSTPVMSLRYAKLRNNKLKETIGKLNR